MQILRFDESDVPAPKRKLASKGWLAIGVVATLMGVGTAFASSTITIPTVSLGQGVAQVTNCDPRVIVSPEATGSVSDDGETPMFRTTSVLISEVSDSCSGADFGLQVYKHFSSDSNERDDSHAIQALNCSQLKATDVAPAITFKCEDVTRTLWLSLGTLTSGDSSFRITTNFTNDIDYVTLVSSAHSGSRFS